MSGATSDVMRKYPLLALCRDGHHGSFSSFCRYGGEMLRRAPGLETVCVEKTSLKGLRRPLRGRHHRASASCLPLLVSL